MELAEIKNICHDVEGSLAYTEAELLYKLAHNCIGKGVIVEVGSFQGKSTIFLGKGSISASQTKVYAIDPHIGEMHKGVYDYQPTWEKFYSNINKYEVENIVFPIRKTSEEAGKYFDEPIELIFIDGLHDYESVKRDFEIWFPKVIPGGIMAFHDTCNSHSGSRDVAYQYIYKSKQFTNTGLINSITFAEKKQASQLDMLLNHLTLLQNYIYEFEAKHPSLPKILKRKIKEFKKKQEKKKLTRI